MTPEEAMRSALAQARRALGRTFPNPAVGAVVFRAGRILGRGATRPPGGDHAEIAALRAAERRFGARALRGASMAVTLEPCCHQGRTGPCSEALVAAGLRRVYVGCRDPHPLVNGRGLRRLRAAGLTVRVGVLGEACREQHRGFLSVWERGRPFVALKLASSLDGRIATASGESRWITGEAARRRVHQLRARFDGVMVGSGTALADDPELSARRGGRVLRRPLRVLVDAALRVPPTARLYQPHPGARTWVLCARRARGRRAIAATGARLLDVPRRGRHLHLRAGLRALAGAGLTTLLVEGGGELAAALLRADLVDEVHWFAAPLLIGGDGRPALGALALRRLADARVLEGARATRLGGDLYLCGRLAPRRPGRRSRRSE
jgi:diaminohydroxyphosphoribosylaminopyrimidine deaminase/5-amino-6-(5-phosphoribosylamino)uracil reductase